MEQMNGRGIIEEVLTRVIYDSWIGQPGWAPWAAGGNSDKQEEARRLARAALSDPAISYATALCQQGEILRQAREFIDTVHDGEYGYSECTRDELVEKIDAALSTSEGKTE